MKTARGQGDILAALRDADASLREQPVPDAVDARVRAALAPSTTSRRRAWVLVGAAAAVLVTVLLWQGAVLEGGERSGPVRVTLERDGRVEERHGALHLLAGSAIFEVRPRAKGEPPVVVHVGEARIEVMGTRFVVTRSSQTGHVRLERGAIRLVHPDGVETRMRPGDEQTFALRRQRSAAVPAAAATAVTVASIAAAPEPAVTKEERPGAATRAKPTARDVVAERRQQVTRAAKPPAAEVNEAVARITALRSAGENQLALTEIDRLLALHLDERTAETLSFEKGLLLEALGDEGACSQWQAHAKRFPQGRYGDVVLQATARLTCPAD